MSEYSTFGTSTSDTAKVAEELKNQLAMANAQQLLKVRYCYFLFHFDAFFFFFLESRTCQKSASKSVYIILVSS